MSDLFRRTAWAMALASTLFIAACDDDDDNGTSNPSPITSPTPTPSASPSPSPTPTPGNQGGQAGQFVSFIGVARQVNEAAGTLRVGGRRVDVDDQTQVQNVSGQAVGLSQLQGRTVRVRGRSFDDGSVLAERITLQP
ncbi:MAG TPA: DUF5666 domain-containing protein [Methylomirabilota bacterium]